jgi:hypothetical protein
MTPKLATFTKIGAFLSLARQDLWEKLVFKLINYFLNSIRFVVLEGSRRKTPPFL